MSIEEAWGDPRSRPLPLGLPRQKASSDWGGARAGWRGASHIRIPGGSESARWRCGLGSATSGFGGGDRANRAGLPAPKSQEYATHHLSHQVVVLGALGLGGWFGGAPPSPGSAPIDAPSGKDEFSVGPDDKVDREALSPLGLDAVERFVLDA